MSSTASKPKLVRLLRGGQMTIPAEIRRELEIDENTMLRVALVDGGFQVTPVSVDEPSQLSPGLRGLYEYFAPVREEILASGITEEELYADIDAAVAAVRAEKRAKQE